jgi:hypothetical protein
MMGKFILSLLLAGCAMGAAWAETGAAESSLTLRGFGTLGLARSSSDHAEFVRDLSQPVGIKGGQWSGRIDCQNSALARRHGASRRPPSASPRSSRSRNGPAHGPCRPAR